MSVFDGPRSDMNKFKIYSNTPVSLDVYLHPDPITYPKVIRVYYNGLAISYVTNRAYNPFGYHGNFIFDLIQLFPMNPVTFNCKLLQDSNHSPNGYDIEVVIIGLASQRSAIENFCNAHNCAFNRH